MYIRRKPEASRESDRSVEHRTLVKDLLPLDIVHKLRALQARLERQEQDNPLKPW